MPAPQTDELRAGRETPAAVRTASPTVDFTRAPFLVIWEVTRACALACVHCRAEAIARRDPRELTTEEGYRLIDRVRAFGDRPPLLVLTGGDPMWRKDLALLVEHGTAAGLSVALTPSGTGMATRARLQALRDAGLARLAVSLDAADAATHDGFRRVRGSFAQTMRIIEAAIELGVPLQINTTISARTLPAFEGMVNFVRDLPLALWAVFFLVQTGRGAALDQVTADECEQVLHRLYDLSLQVPFGIKTTEAPHYQRVVWERERAVAAERFPPTVVAQPFSPANRPTSPRVALRAPRSVTDGNGFLFVDHVGNICPSGFLPLSCGNARQTDLVATYRQHALFRQLRDPDALEGKCGRCRFRAICGGSRSRAYSTFGNPLASDPLCAYEPPAEREPIVQR